MLRSYTAPLISAVMFLPPDIRAEVQRRLGDKCWEDVPRMRSAVDRATYLESGNEWMIAIMYYQLIAEPSLLTTGLDYKTYLGIVKGTITENQTFFYPVVKGHELLFFEGVRRTALTESEQDEIIRLSIHLFRHAQEIIRSSGTLSEDSLTIRDLVRFNVDFSLFYLLNVHQDGAHDLGGVIRQFILTAHNVYARVLDTPEARKKFVQAIYDAFLMSREGQSIFFKATQTGDFSMTTREKIEEIIDFSDYTDFSRKPSEGQSPFQASLDAMVERSYQVSRPLLIVSDKDDVPLVEDKLAGLEKGDGKTVRLSSSPFSKRKDLFGMYMPKRDLPEDRVSEILAPAGAEARENAVIAVLGLSDDVSVREDVRRRMDDLMEDPVVRQSVAAYLDNPGGWRNQMEWHEGFMAELARRAAEDPDGRYTVVIDNVESYPSRVRVQLNPVLWEKKVGVPDRGYEVTLPPNLQFIFTMDRQSFIQDDSFLSRTLVHFTHSMSASRQGYIAAKTGIRPSTEKKLWELLAALRGTSWAYDPDWNLTDLVQIALRVRGRVADGPGAGEEFFLSAEAANYLKLRLRSGEDWRHLDGLLRASGLMDADEPKLSFSQGKLLFDGVELELGDEFAEAVRQRGDRSPAQLLLDVYGFALTKMEQRVLCQLARDWKYGGRTVQIEGPSGEGKTTISRVFSKMIGLKIAERTVNAETGPSDLRGSFEVTQEGRFAFHEAAYVGELSEGGYAHIFNEINTNPDGGVYLYLYPEIAGQPRKFLPEFAPSDPAEKVRVAAVSRGNMRFFAINSENNAGRFPVPPRVAALIPRYQMYSDPADLPGLVQDFFDKDPKLRPLAGLARPLAEVHRRIWNAKNDLNTIDSPQDVTRRLILRTLERVKTGLAEGDEPKTAFARATAEVYGLMWKNAADIEAAMSIVREELSRAGVSFVDPDRSGALVHSLKERTPTMVFDDGAGPDSAAEVEMLLGRDRKLAAETVRVPLSFFHARRQWLGGWAPGDREAGEAEGTVDKALRRLKPDLAFGLGILPNLIHRARLVAARGDAGSPARLVAILEDYTHLNEKVTPLLNEFFQTDRLEAVEEMITQGNADALFAELHAAAGSGADVQKLVEGYVPPREWRGADAASLIAGYVTGDAETAPLRLDFAKWYYSHAPPNLKFVATAHAEENTRLAGPELDRFAAVNLSVPMDRRWVEGFVAAELRRRSVDPDSPAGKFAVAAALEALAAYQAEVRTDVYDHVRLGRRDLEIFAEEFAEAYAAHGTEADFLADRAPRIAYYTLGIGLRLGLEGRQKLSFYPPVTEPEKRLGYRKDTRGVWLVADGIEVLTEYADIPETGRFKAATESSVRQLASLAIAWKRGRVSVIEGYPGGGKTASVSEIAARVGVAQVDEIMYDGIDPGVFLGRLSKKGDDFILTGMPTGAGEYAIPFLKAYAAGGAVNLDEGAVGSNSQEMLVFLSRLALEPEIDLSQFHPGYRGPVLKRHPNFRLFITQNPAGSTLDRLPVPPSVNKVAHKVWTDNEISKEDAVRIIDHYLGPAYKDRVPAALKERMAGIHIAFLKRHPAKEELSPRQLILMAEGVRQALLRSPGVFSEEDQKMALFRGVMVAYFERLSQGDRQSLVDILGDLAFYMNRWRGPVEVTRDSFGGVPMTPGQGSDVDPADVVYPEDIESQNGAMRAMAYGLSLGMPVALMPAEGADDYDLVRKFALKTGRKLETLWSHPHMGRMHLVSAVLPILQPEFDRYGVRQEDVSQEFRMALGFLLRHTMTREELAAAKTAPKQPEQLLFFHLMDAIPERQRVVLNLFLSRMNEERRISVEDEKGVVVERVLPPWVNLVISAPVEHRFSSAFINRFLPVRLEPFGYEETRRIVGRRWPLVDEREFDWMWKICQAASTRDKESLFGLRYGFTPADIFKLASVVQAEKKRHWLPLNKDPFYYVLKAAQTVYLGALEEQDLRTFEGEVVLPLFLEIFRGPIAASQITAGEIVRYYGFMKSAILKELSHVETRPAEKRVRIDSLKEGEDHVWANGMRIRCESLAEEKYVITTPARSYPTTLTALKSGHVLSKEMEASFEEASGEIVVRYQIVRSIGGIAVPQDDWNRERALPMHEVATSAFMEMTPEHAAYLASLLQAWEPRVDKAGRVHRPRVAMINGETGVAKTTGMVDYAAITGVPVYVLNSYEDLKASDITLGMRVDAGKIEVGVKELLARIGRVRRLPAPGETGEAGAWKKIQLPGKTMTSRVLVVWDEANVSSDLAYVLAPLFRGEKRFTIEYGGESLEVEVEDEVEFAMTFNPAEKYGGRESFSREIVSHAYKYWPANPTRYADDQLVSILKEYHRRGVGSVRDAMERRLSVGAPPEAETYVRNESLPVSGTPAGLEALDAAGEHAALQPEWRYANPDDSPDWVHAIRAMIGRPQPEEEEGPTVEEPRGAGDDEERVQTFSMNYDLPALQARIDAFGGAVPPAGIEAFANEVLAPFLEAVSDMALNEDNDANRKILQGVGQLARSIDPSCEVSLRSIHAMYLAGDVSETVLWEHLSSLRRVFAEPGRGVYLIVKGVSPSQDGAPYLFLKGHRILEHFAQISSADLDRLGIDSAGAISKKAYPRAVVLEKSPKAGLGGYFEGEFAVVFKDVSVAAAQGHASPEMAVAWTAWHELGHMIDQARFRAERYPIPENIELNSMLFPLIFSSGTLEYLGFLQSWLKASSDPDDVYAQATKGILNGLWIRHRELAGGRTLYQIHQDGFLKAELESQLIGDRFERDKVDAIVEALAALGPDAVRQMAAHVYQNRKDYLYTAKPGLKKAKGSGGGGWAQDFMEGTDAGYPEKLEGTERNKINVESKSDAKRPSYKKRPGKGSGGKGGSGGRQGGEPEKGGPAGAGTGEKGQTPEADLLAADMDGVRVPAGLLKRFLEIFAGAPEIIKYLSEDGDEINVEEMMRNFRSQEIFMTQKVRRALAQVSLGLAIDVSGSTGDLRTVMTESGPQSKSINQIFIEVAKYYLQLFQMAASRNKGVEFTLAAHGNAFYPLLRYRDSRKKHKVQEALAELIGHGHSEGNDFTAVIQAIIEKHKKESSNESRMEIVLVDGQVDVPEELLLQAHREGIDIVIMGYDTPEVLKFPKSVNLPLHASPEVILSTILRLALLKNKKGLGGKLPYKKDLGPELGLAVSPAAGARLASGDSGRPRLSWAEAYASVPLTVQAVFGYLAGKTGARLARKDSERQGASWLGLSIFGRWFREAGAFWRRLSGIFSGSKNRPLDVESLHESAEAVRRDPRIATPQNFEPFLQALSRRGHDPVFDAALSETILEYIRAEDRLANFQLYRAVMSGPSLNRNDLQVLRVCIPFKMIDATPRDLTKILAAMRAGDEKGEPVLEALDAAASLLDTHPSAATAENIRLVLPVFADTDEASAEKAAEIIRIALAANDAVFGVDEFYRPLASARRLRPVLPSIFSFLAVHPELASDRDFKVFLAAVSDPDEQAAEYALRILAVVAHVPGRARAEAMAAASNRLSDPSADVRRSAAEAVAALSKADPALMTAETARKYLPLLQDSHVYTKRTAWKIFEVFRPSAGDDTQAMMGALGVLDSSRNVEVVPASGGRPAVRGDDLAGWIVESGARPQAFAGLQSALAGIYRMYLELRSAKNLPAERAEAYARDFLIQAAYEFLEEEEADGARLSYETVKLRPAQLAEPVDVPLSMLGSWIQGSQDRILHENLLELLSVLPNSSHPSEILAGVWGIISSKPKLAENLDIKRAVEPFIRSNLPRARQMAIQIFVTLLDLDRDSVSAADRDLLLSSISGNYRDYTRFIFKGLEICLEADPSLARPEDLSVVLDLMFSNATLLGSDALVGEFANAAKRRGFPNGFFTAEQLQPLLDICFIRYPTNSALAGALFDILPIFEKVSLRVGVDRTPFTAGNLRVVLANFSYPAIRSLAPDMIRFFDRGTAGFAPERRPFGSDSLKAILQGLVVSGEPAIPSTLRVLEVLSHGVKDDEPLEAATKSILSALSFDSISLEIDGQRKTLGRREVLEWVGRQLESDILFDTFLISMTALGRLRKDQEAHGVSTEVVQRWFEKTLYDLIRGSGARLSAEIRLRPSPESAEMSPVYPWNLNRWFMEDPANRATAENLQIILEAFSDPGARFSNGVDSLLEIFFETDKKVFAPDQFEIVMKMISGDSELGRVWAFKALSFFLRADSSYATADRLKVTLKALSSHDDWIRTAALQNVSVFFEADKRVFTHDNFKFMFGMFSDAGEEVQTSILAAFRFFLQVDPVYATPDNLKVVLGMLAMRYWQHHREVALQLLPYFLEANTEAFTSDNLNIVLKMLSDLQEDARGNALSAIPFFVRANKAVFTPEKLKTVLEMFLYKNFPDAHLAALMALPHFLEANKDSYSLDNFEMILGMLSSDTATTRLSALKAIPFFLQANPAYATPENLDLVLKTLSDADDEIRRAALRALLSFIETDHVYATPDNLRIVLKAVLKAPSDGNRFMLAGLVSETFLSLARAGQKAGAAGEGLSSFAKALELALTARETRIHFDESPVKPADVVFEPEDIVVWMLPQLNGASDFARLQEDLTGFWRMRQDLLAHTAGIEHARAMADQVFFAALYRRMQGAPGPSGARLSRTIALKTSAGLTTTDVQLKDLDKWVSEDPSNRATAENLGILLRDLPGLSWSPRLTFLGFLKFLNTRKEAFTVENLKILTGFFLGFDDMVRLRALEILSLFLQADVAHASPEVLKEVLVMLRDKNPAIRQSVLDLLPPFLQADKRAFTSDNLVIVFEMFSAADKSVRVYALDAFAWFLRADSAYASPQNLAKVLQVRPNGSDIKTLNTPRILELFVDANPGAFNLDSLKVLVEMLCDDDIDVRRSSFCTLRYFKEAAQKMGEKGGDLYSFVSALEMALDFSNYTINPDEGHAPSAWTVLKNGDVVRWMRSRIGQDVTFARLQQELTALWRMRQDLLARTAGQADAETMADQVFFTALYRRVQETAGPDGARPLSGARLSAAIPMKPSPESAFTEEVELDSVVGWISVDPPKRTTAENLKAVLQKLSDPELHACVQAGRAVQGFIRDKKTFTADNFQLVHNALSDGHWLVRTSGLNALSCFLQADAAYATPENLRTVLEMFSDPAVQHYAAAALPSFVRADRRAFTPDNFKMFVDIFSGQNGGSLGGLETLSSLIRADRTYAAPESLRMVLKTLLGENEDIRNKALELLSPLFEANPSAYTPENYQLALELMSHSDPMIRAKGVRALPYFIRANPAYANFDGVRVSLAAILTQDMAFFGVNLLIRSILSPFEEASQKTGPAAEELNSFVRALLLALDPDFTRIDISDNPAKTVAVGLARRQVADWMKSRMGDDKAFAELRGDLTGLWRIRKELLERMAGMNDAEAVANQVFFTALYRLTHEAPKPSGTRLSRTIALKPSAGLTTTDVQLKDLEEWVSEDPSNRATAENLGILLEQLPAISFDFMIAIRPIDPIFLCFFKANNKVFNADNFKIAIKHIDNEYRIVRQNAAAILELFIDANPDYGNADVLRAISRVGYDGASMNLNCMADWIEGNLSGRATAQNLGKILLDFQNSDAYEKRRICEVVESMLATRREIATSDNFEIVFGMLSRKLSVSDVRYVLRMLRLFLTAEPAHATPDCLEKLLRILHSDEYDYDDDIISTVSLIASLPGAGERVFTAKNFSILREFFSSFSTFQKVNGLKVLKIFLKADASYATADNLGMVLRMLPPDNDSVFSGVLLVLEAFVAADKKAFTLDNMSLVLAMFSDPNEAVRDCALDILPFFIKADAQLFTLGSFRVLIMALLGGVEDRPIQAFRFFEEAAKSRGGEGEELSSFVSAMTLALTPKETLLDLSEYPQKPAPTLLLRQRIIDWVGPQLNSTRGYDLLRSDFIGFWRMRQDLLARTAGQADAETMADQVFFTALYRRMQEDRPTSAARLATGPSPASASISSVAPKNAVQWIAEDPQNRATPENLRIVLEKSPAFGYNFISSTLSSFLGANRAAFTPDNLHVVLTMLSDKAVNIPLCALDALYYFFEADSNFADSENLGKVVEMLSDADFDVRQKAYQVLQDLSFLSEAAFTAGGLKKLLKIFSEDREDVRLLGLKALRIFEQTSKKMDSAEEFHSFVSAVMLAMAANDRLLDVSGDPANPRKVVVKTKMVLDWMLSQSSAASYARLQSDLVGFWRMRQELLSRTAGIDRADTMADQVFFTALYRRIQEDRHMSAARLATGPSPAPKPEGLDAALERLSGTEPERFRSLAAAQEMVVGAPDAATAERFAKILPLLSDPKKEIRFKALETAVVFVRKNPKLWTSAFMKLFLKAMADPGIEAAAERTLFSLSFNAENDAASMGGVIAVLISHRNAVVTLADGNQDSLKGRMLVDWVISLVDDERKFQEAQTALAGIYRLYLDLSRTGPLPANFDGRSAGDFVFQAVYNYKYKESLSARGARLADTAAARPEVSPGSAGAASISTAEREALETFFRRLAEARPAETFSKDLAVFLRSMGAARVFRARRHGDAVEIYLAGETVPLARLSAAAGVKAPAASPLSEGEEALTAQGFMTLVKLAAMEVSGVEVSVPHAIALPVDGLAPLADPVKFRQAFEIVFLQALGFRNAVSGQKPVILLSGAGRLSPAQSAIIDELLSRHLDGRRAGAVRKGEAAAFEGIVFSVVDASALSSARVRSKNEITLSVRGLWETDSPRNLVPYLAGGYGLLAGVARKAWDGKAAAIDRAAVSSDDLPRGLLGQYSQAIGREVGAAELLGLAFDATSPEAFRGLACPLPLIRKMDWSRISGSVWRSVTASA